MKKVLVIGSDGALGAELVRALKRVNDYEVHLASRNPQSPLTHKLDIQERENIDSLIRELVPDLIFNLAASFSGNLDEVLKINVRSTISLLEAVKAYVPKCRVMLMGSAAEYGFILPEENPVSEDHALNPLTAYGLSKSIQSEVAKFFGRQGMDVIVCRIFNLEGDNISPHLFIGRLQKEIQEVLCQKKLHIELGSLNAIRDYIDLEGASLQLVDIAQLGKSGEIYNVASGIPITMLELMKKYLSKYNLPVSIVKSDQSLGNHKGYDVPVLYADISKTISLIKANPRGY